MHVAERPRETVTEDGLLDRDHPTVARLTVVAVLRYELTLEVDRSRDCERKRHGHGEYISEPGSVGDVRRHGGQVHAGTDRQRGDSLCEEAVRVLDVRVRRSRIASDAQRHCERPRRGKSKEAILGGELEVPLQGAAVERKLQIVERRVRNPEAGPRTSIESEEVSPVAVSEAFLEAMFEENSQRSRAWNFR